MRIAAGVEYDGSQFSGWQRQRGASSVQEYLENAISAVADHPVTVVAAGRTDAGVHAQGQVVHFDTGASRSEYSWVRGSNSALPPSIALRWTRPVEDSFHARFAAIERRYRYVLLNRAVAPTYLAGHVSWHYRPLDLAVMRTACAGLLGRHDFSAFRAAGCQARTPVRELRHLQVYQQGEWFWFDAWADAFLHHMVRNIVGTLIRIGEGRQDPDWMQEVLASRDRCRAGLTATGDGLYLSGVRYPPQCGLPPPPAPCRFW